MSKVRELRTLIKILFLAVMISGLAACQPTPEHEAIQQKGNTDKTIQKNETKVTKDEIKDIISAPEKANFEVKTDNGNADIIVDADVIVPQVNAIPVVRILRDDLQDEDIEPMCKIFFGDSVIFPVRSYEEYTKDELLDEITKVQKMLDNVKEDQKDAYDKKAKPFIEHLQSLISTAPDTVTLNPVKEYKFEKPDEYGNYMFQAQGDIGGINGQIMIQKADSYCSCMFYVDDPNGNGYYTKDQIADSDGEAATNMDNHCKYSLDEAVDLCKDLLKQLGCDKDFSYLWSEQITKTLPSEGGKGYDGYRIRFSRSYQGIADNSVNYRDDYVKETADDGTFPAAYEMMDFTVTDDGIIYFDWESPMKFGDVQAENVKLLDYSEIEDIFKQQIKIRYADAQTGTAVSISQIRLGYMRVKDKDNNSYTLVPAWDFLADEYGLTSYFTINAIDGSVLNRSIGY